MKFKKVTVLKIFQSSLEKVAICREYTYSVIKYVTLIEKLEFERTRKLKQPLIFD